MIVFFVDSDQEGGMYGPYSEMPLAETALKIVRMTNDDAAELVSYDMDPFGEQLLSGLRPFKMEIMLLGGKVQSVDVSALATSGDRGAGHGPGGLPGALCLGQNPKRGEDQGGQPGIEGTACRPLREGLCIFPSCRCPALSRRCPGSPPERGRSR